MFRYMVIGYNQRIHLVRAIAFTQYITDDVCYTAVAFCLSRIGGGSSAF